MSNAINHRFARLTLALPLLAVLTASAQSINEDLKLTASDSAANDEFGYSVAISATTAIVGAIFNSDAIPNSGSAYLFDTTTGQQLFKLTASDAAPTDYFGGSVAISGTTAIVGAFDNDDAGSTSGSAYLFDTTTGQQLFKLTASDAEVGDFFGGSVAISGTTAIIGARYDDHASRVDAGAAYLYDTTTGQQLFKLTASDAAEEDIFGFSVAISGTTAIVGARADDVAGTDSGSAYIFDTTTGQQLFKLTASDAAEFDNFGESVAISGSMAIIGAPGDGDAGTGSGSAYIFDTTTGQQLFKLTASDAAEFHIFGYSVAISGTTAIVGAHLGGDAGFASGSAYMFDITTGQQRYKLTASESEAGDEFGFSVAVSDNTAIVGAHNDNDAGSRSGSAYLFDLNLAEPCPADLTGEGDLNFFDVSAFLVAYNGGDPIADFTGDGVFNFFDVSAFLVAYNAGCP